MQDHVTVEIAHAAVPADSPTAEGGVQRQSWMATVNGAVVPLVAFDVQPADEGGRALVSLVVAADAVSVGRPPASQPAPATSQPKRSVWGDPNAPDPRQAIIAALEQAEADKQAVPS